MNRVGIYKVTEYTDVYNLIFRFKSDDQQKKNLRFIFVVKYS